MQHGMEQVEPRPPPRPGVCMPCAAQPLQAQKARVRMRMGTPRTRTQTGTVRRRLVRCFNGRCCWGSAACFSSASDTASPTLTAAASCAPETFKRSGGSSRASADCACCSCLSGASSSAGTGGRRWPAGRCPRLRAAESGPARAGAGIATPPMSRWRGASAPTFSGPAQGSTCGRFHSLRGRRGWLAAACALLLAAAPFVPASPLPPGPSPPAARSAPLTPMSGRRWQRQTCCSPACQPRRHRRSPPSRPPLRRRPWQCCQGPTHAPPTPAPPPLQSHPQLCLRERPPRATLLPPSALRLPRPQTTRTPSPCLLSCPACRTLRQGEAAGCGERLAWHQTCKIGPACTKQRCCPNSLMQHAMGFQPPCPRPSAHPHSATRSAKNACTGTTRPVALACLARKT